jgi:hypothetical protein
MAGSAAFPPHASISATQDHFRPAARVEVIEGAIAVVSGNGAVNHLNPLDSLYQEDSIHSLGGSVRIAFTDGTSFSIAEQGRVWLKHVGYDAQGKLDVLTLVTADGAFSVEPDPLGRTTIVIETFVADIYPNGSAVNFWHAAADGLRVELGGTAESAEVLVENSRGRAM